MASIIQVRGKWRAQVRRRGQKHTRTFNTHAEATAWALATEAEVAKQPKPKEAPPPVLTIAECVAAYRKLRLDIGRPIAATSNQHYMLNHLAADLGPERPQDLTPQRMVAWASLRKKEGAGPYTIYMEISALGSLLKNVASYRNFVVPDVVGMARPLLYHLQLIGGGGRRSRRVLPGELEALYAALPKYADALRVAVAIGLRRGELVTIQWRDLDEVNRAVLVRGRKHPRAIEKRDEWVPLLGDAWAIVQRQPRIAGEPRIFPFHPQTLTKAITDTTRALGIPNLHLHDLRHEASSTLQERGFDEVERMAILGHTRPAMNARYTHVTLPALHAKADAPAQGTQPGRRRARKAGRPRQA